MMTTADKLNASLASILHGDPWYGPNIYNILDEITFEAAYEKLPHAAHNSTAILLHMIGWTEEVTQRMNGKPAGDPAIGDWPDPGHPEEEKWRYLINSFKLANDMLMDVIAAFPVEQWTQPICDGRLQDSGTAVTHQALIEGLIQHHIYHSGQLALKKSRPYLMSAYKA